MGIHSSVRLFSQNIADSRRVPVKVRRHRARIGTKAGASGVHLGVGRILGLLLLCFVVGVVLAFLGTTPATLFSDLTGALLHAWGIVVDLLGWALPYIILGAMVVLPLAVVSWLIRLARRS
jgi:hypothetical protein